MKIALFIASKKGYGSLRKLIENNHQSSIGFVSSFKETNVKKSYDEDISILCRENGIDYFPWHDIKDRLFTLCRDKDITVAFAISWKFLIDTEINNIIPNGLIVFHDSLLPKYRGFAPTPTAIICGDNKIGVTALIAGDKADNGDIILQREMKIDKSEYIKEIIDRQSELMGDMLLEIIYDLKEGNITYTPQDEAEVTYSIWRNPEDCRIDWNQSADDIYNFIRAVSDPYPGAFTFYKGERITVNRALVLDYDMEFAIRDTGKIWSVIDNSPVVICKEGMLKITEALSSEGLKIKFDRLRERLD